MKSDTEGRESRSSRVELKYCERCGGLWLRELGGGEVYCEKCRPLVAELPPPRKKPQRVMLPVRSRTAVEDYAGDRNDDLEAAGGAA